VKGSTRLLVLVSLLFIFLPPVLAAQQVSLTILHTNDTHSHLLPFSYPSAVPAGSDIAALKTKRDIGGIARRATLVKRLKADLERSGTTVWLVDAGDFSDGTSFSTEYHGEADITAMNAAGYDFGTLGNHEFNNSLERLKALIAKAGFPLLCANAIETATGKPLVSESAWRDVGPLKIGLFGLLVRDAAGYQAGKEGVTVSDEVAAAQRMVKTLRSKAGIVVAISHAGEILDRKMAQVVPGLDVIIGGHSHSRLPFGDFQWRSEELKDKDVNGTIIVQAHQWGGELGRLDLLFDKDPAGVWHVSRFRARLIPVTSDIPEDESVAAVVDRYWKPIAGRYGEVIGQAADDFGTRGDDMAPYNFVADLVRETTGTELELENTGGIRSGFVKGKITLEDIVSMDPFDNAVVTFKATGRQIREILLKMRPAVSGIRYRLENGRLTEFTIGGQPVADDRVYSGATNSFLAERALKGTESVNTGKIRREVIIDYIRKKGTVKPVYDGRRVVVGQPLTTQ
jgi:5'-nucleotidase/UDP-sugar diphosphatase